MKIDSETETLQKIISRLGEKVTQKKAQGIIERLYENSVISEREKYLMKIVVHRKVLDVDLPYRDYVRSRILKNMLKIILKSEDGEE
ncbi:MAG: hypothetical protein ACOC5A_04140 [Halanaerobiales bacterium]